MKPAARRLLVPTLMTIAMMIVLVWLGTWQTQRLIWKQDILARIAKAEIQPPIPLPEDPPAFAKVAVTGTMLMDKAALYGADVRITPSGPTMGARQIVPLRRPDGRVILVDRGWVPLERTGPMPPPPDPVTVAGYIRMGDHPGWFSATDDPAARRFFTLDPAAIGAATGFPAIPPFILVLLAPQPGPEPTIVTKWPEPAFHEPRPSNNHLAYAITWYGLALTLLIIFAVWALKGRTS